MVYNTALSYVQNNEDAEEVTQDVFIELHRSLDSFKEESSLKTWIYRIAINKSLDYLKYRNRKKRMGILSDIFKKDSLEPAHHIADFEHPGVKFENKEKAKILFKAINTLPEAQKTAFILAKVEGLGNLQIGEIMNRHVGAIESLLSRAKENLKRELGGFYKE